VVYSMERPEKKIKVFYSYAKADEKWSRLLRKYMSEFRNQETIEELDDSMIRAGELYSQAHTRMFKSAQIILLLISPDFLEDAQCQIDLRNTFEVYKQTDAHVIPIIVQAYSWRDLPIGRLQCLPTNGIPISLSRNQDETIFDVTKAIQRVVDSIFTEYTGSISCCIPPPPIIHNALLGAPPPRSFGPFILFLLITMVIVASISSGIFSLSPLVSFVKASGGTLLFLSQMVLLTTSLCLIPTITYWITKQRNRLVHLSLESLLFLLLFVGFSLWMLGRLALGNWIFYAAALILLLEAESNFVEWNKDSTLNRLSKAITFKHMTTDADAIKKLFRHEVILYAAVIVGVIIGTLVGLVSHQVPKIILLDCLQCVLLLASLVLLYFLGLRHCIGNVPEETRLALYGLILAGTSRGGAM
jgi:hypothetical protein